MEPEVRLADGRGRRTNLAQVSRVNKPGKRQEEVAVPLFFLEAGRGLRGEHCACPAEESGRKCLEKETLLTAQRVALHPAEMHMLRTGRFCTGTGWRR